MPLPFLSFTHEIEAVTAKIILVSPASIIVLGHHRHASHTYTGVSVISKKSNSFFFLDLSYIVCPQVGSAAVNAINTSIRLDQQIIESRIENKQYCLPISINICFVCPKRTVTLRRFF